MPKSCLKIPTPPMSPGGDGSHRRKCVAFSAEDLERIYIADEWDRTPTEVAQKLTYGDVLELKAIQRSLPTAPQLPDPLARRAQAQYLKGVPIGLLPLFDDSQPCNSVAGPARSKSPPELAPVPSRSPSFTPTRPSSLSSSTPISASPTFSPTRSATTLPTNSYPSRPKSKFNFLPLLDAPTPPSPPPPPPPPSSEVDTDDSDHDLSTPALSSASLDTTPSPREYSQSESPSYFQLSTCTPSPSRNSHFASYPSATHRGASATNSTLINSTPFSLHPLNTSGYPKNASPKKPRESPLTLDINGETFHFGPMSDSPISPPPSPRVQSSARFQPSKYSPPPLLPSSFDRERGQDLQPSFSRSTARNQGPPPQKPPMRTKDFHNHYSPPSPNPGSTYCASMKRGGSPCASPVLSPVRGRSTVSRKGRLEH